MNDIMDWVICPQAGLTRILFANVFFDATGTEVRYSHCLLNLYTSYKLDRLLNQIQLIRLDVVCKSATYQLPYLYNIMHLEYMRWQGCGGRGAATLQRGEGAGKRFLFRGINMGARTQRKNWRASFHSMSESLGRGKPERANLFVTQFQEATKVSFLVIDGTGAGVIFLLAKLDSGVIYLK